MLHKKIFKNTKEYINKEQSLMLNSKFYNSKDSYFILLVIYNCSLLMSIGSGPWKYPWMTAFIVVMVGLQFLSKAFWFTTFLSFIPFYFVHIPLFPRLTNHGNLEVFIGFIILFFIIFKFKKIKNQSLDYTQIRDVFIYALVTTYFITGFHKLNSGFFDITSSCTKYVSSTFNEFLFGSNFKLSPIIIRITQILTILFEMVIPFGLLFIRTRKTTIWLFVSFHFYMSLCNFSNFSALAGFLLCGCIIDFNLNEKSRKQILKGLRVYIFFVLTSVLLSYFITRLGFLNRSFVRVYNGIFFNIGWVIFFLVLLKNSTNTKRYSKLRGLPIIFVLFITIWGVQPYLGLSNAGNLTMFSNLKTEKSQNNHYIINTKKTKIWDFEEDLVTMINVPDSLKWQHRGSLKGYQLPLIEFKSQANLWINKYQENIELTISHKGKIINIPNLKSSEYSKVKWWYNYVYYRRLPEGKINECLW